jgi:hypothetical protein
MDVRNPPSVSPRQIAAPETVVVRPFLLKPQWMNGLSERLIVSITKMTMAARCGG